ncbi:MAG: response regulator [Pseudomonadales bacterium]|nr:response regulator [Pseudomonadales bacterium]
MGRLFYCSQQQVFPSVDDGRISNGYLLFSRLCDEKLLQRISEINNQEVFIILETLSNAELHFNVLNDDQVQGSFNLYDYKEQPLFALGIVKERKIQQYGKAINRTILLTILSLGVLTAMAAYLLINQLVIKKIASLRQFIQSYSENRKLEQPIFIKGRCEISDLGQDFNTLIKTITAHEKELQQTTLAAEAANRSKSEFIANMSHEIRTPMTAILGFTELIKAGNIDDDEKKEYLLTIEKNGQQLLALINEVLDLAKVEAGNFNIHKHDIRLEPMVNEVLTLMQAPAKKSQLLLKLNYLSAIPETLNTDADRVKQILINLIGNAIKFTPSGNVSVDIEVDELEHRLNIAVSDTGIGMDSNTIKNIFQPFYQDESASNRQFQGTGLGLSISKTLSDKMAAPLTVKSELTKGSTFTLRLPYAAETPLIEASLMNGKSVPKVHHRELLSGSVFVIDDNSVISLLVCKILNNFGIDTLSDNDSVNAVNSLLEGKIKPDFVLMDMQMPILDGYQATRKLKAAGFDKPIIAITANSMMGDKEKCMQAGCDGFLSKPIGQNTLYKTCEVLLMQEYSE